MLCSCVQLILEFGTLGDLSKCKANAKVEANAKNLKQKCIKLEAN